MAFLQVEYHSNVLGMERYLNVIYPDLAIMTEGEEDIPVLYLLHGMGGNENSWRKRTAIERLLRQTNLMVVMPSTDLAWYTNTQYGLDYYKALVEELPQVLRHLFPKMSRKREKTFIAGLSMGGYGAFKLALLSNQFAYAGSFSGALDFDRQALLEHAEAKLSYWQGIFGDFDQPDFAQHLLPNMVDQHDGQTTFYAWCGQEDYLFSANQTGVAALRKAGLSVDYQVGHGTHDWYYWEKQLEVFLEMLPIDYIKEQRLS
ncbi:alpha/beta hydrolase [Streptococcus cuniculipharyngis]|uniref:Esterase family protein n=1 Tax=Streptococcus cuniculipharyngis TaxID=1562651 RepID=A0A5C5SGX6_9STRE|nr:alpha/beta hydrolase family protein [Streptococcus cuniculipharyngis]TWS99195.1 esterase family protein [Streptococcus cuniculipharyngis]